MRLLVPALLLTGCLHRYEPIRTAARAERADQLDEAEGLWRDALTEPLAQVEWATAHRHLCRLRERRITEASNGLAAADVDPAILRGWRTDLQSCGPDADLQVRLRRLHAERLALDLDAITPDARHGHVFDAHPLVRQTAPESPWRPTYAGWLDAWRAHLTDLPTGGTVADDLRATLLDQAGGTGTHPPGDPTRALLDLHEASFEVVGRGTCAETFPSQVETGAGPGGAVRITVELTGCSTNERTKLVDVPYQVQRFRLEEVQKTRMEMVPTQYPVTRQVGAPRCYQVSDTHQECFTTYSTEYVASQTLQEVSYTEMVQVPYTATEYRKEQRYVRTSQATATVRVQTPDRDGQLTAEVLQDQGMEASPTPAGPAWSRLREQTRRAHESAMKVARAWRLDHLVARADLNTLEGVEDRLAAARAGRSLSASERGRIAATLDLPLAALQPDPPVLTELDALPLPPDPASRRANIDIDGVLRFGVPILALSVGAGTAAGTALPTHARPRSVEGTLRYDVNYSLVGRTPVGSFGFHLVGVVGAHGGFRTQSRYDYPTLRLGQVDTEREPRGAWGLQGAVAGLVGYRNPVFGVFVGGMPRAMYQRIGLTRMGAVGVPIAARLELRLVPRMPLLITAWSDLPTNTDPSTLPDTMGAHVMFPVSRGIWLVGEHARETTRTQVPGLHDEDWVEAGPQAFSRSWAGLALGF